MSGHRIVVFSSQDDSPTEIFQSIAALLKQTMYGFLFRKKNKPC